MKKFFLLILVLAILTSTCLTVGAATTFVPAHPKGYSNDRISIAGTVDRTAMEQLCKGSDGSYSYTNLGTALSLGLTSSEKSGTLDAAAIADVADVKHGISLIGASKLDRRISAVSDGVWTTGGATLGGIPAGAGGWTLDQYFYNEKGETQQDTTPNPEKGYIYTSLLTYNFGSAKQLDYMIFAPYGSNLITGAPVAGDLYVSNDGTNWTLASYYDIAETRINGTYGENRAFDCFPEKYLGKDRNGGTSTNQYGIAFCLEGIEAQYLRIAFTAGRSKSSGSTYESLFNNVLGTGAEITSGIRDILIIGSDPKSADNESICFSYIQNTPVTDGTFNIRMIAEVDSLQYQSAGFQVQLSYFGQSNSTANPTAKSGKKDYFTATAYSSLLSITEQSSEVVTPAEGNYFIALCITDIPADTHLLILKITPVATDANGQQITGDSHCAVFLDGVYQTVYSLPLAF